MDVKRIQSKSVEAFTQKLSNTKGSTSQLSGNLAQNSDEIVCFVIKTRNRAEYWGGVHLLLYAALTATTMPVYTRVGFLISFLFAFYEDPGVTMIKASSALQCPIHVVTFTVRGGVLVADSADTEGQLILQNVYDDLQKYNRQSDVSLNIIDMSDLAGAGGTLQSYIGTLRHLLFIASKAVTNHAESVTYAQEKITALEASKTIVGLHLLGKEAAGMAAQLISGSFSIRKAIVILLIEAEVKGAAGGEVYAALGHAAQFLKNTGMTAVDIIMRHITLPGSPIMCLRDLAGDIANFSHLIDIYIKRGQEAPYIKFVNNFDAGSFNVGGFSNLYAAALGIASIVDPNMYRYNAIATVQQSKYFMIGVAWAKANKHRSDANAVQDLGVSAVEMADLEDLVKNISAQHENR